MITRISFGLGLMLLLSGCTQRPYWKAYEGPELPSSKIASLHARVSYGEAVALMALIIPLPVIKHRTSVHRIDGKHPHAGKAFMSSPKRYHILPGQHTVTVAYDRHPDVCLARYGGCWEQQLLSINFSAQAGREYRVPAEKRGKRTWIWVEEVPTGKMVAGEKPPKAESEKDHATKSQEKQQNE